MGANFIDITKGSLRCVSRRDIRYPSRTGAHDVVELAVLRFVLLNEQEAKAFVVVMCCRVIVNVFLVVFVLLFLPHNVFVENLPTSQILVKLVVPYKALEGLMPRARLHFDFKVTLVIECYEQLVACFFVEIEFLCHQDVKLNSDFPEI